MSEKVQTTSLFKMTQNELISWIQSLPEDASFSVTVKQEIIKGIEQYAKNEGSEVTGEDFYEAEDANDIVELTGVKKKKARAMLKKIAVKKQEEFDKKVPKKAPNKKCLAEVFSLNIQAMRGKMYTIKNVTKATYVREVKKRFLLELGNEAAADQYSGKVDQWNKNDGSIELKKSGKNMMDNKTLEDYGITNTIEAAMPLVVSFKVRGGSHYESKETHSDDDKYRKRKLRLSSSPDCIMGYTNSDGIRRAEIGNQEASFKQMNVDTI